MTINMTDSTRHGKLASARRKVPMVNSILVDLADH